MVSKKRGSGFLSVPEQLDVFLDEVCNGLEKMQVKLSIKTRIGQYDADEFPYLIEIFGRYPLSELIVHPRVQKDLYKNTPNLDAFSLAYENMNSQSALCCNGDIFYAADYENICLRFPELTAVMMRRGLLQSPSLAEEIKVRENSGSLKMHQKAVFSARFLDEKSMEDERKRLYMFYRRLLDDYFSVLYEEKSV